LRILLTGSTGQIGSELRSLLSADEVHAPTRAELDLGDPRNIRDAVRAFAPDVIINPAAYTAVDAAEKEREAATQVNAIAPGILGEEARRLGIALIHFSTDYVFDGNAQAPYREDDPTAPLNVYGRTKLDGESAIRASGCIHLILRTGWVYSRHGKNFLLTIERLARERNRLTIVADQIGTPNWSRDLARAAARLARLGCDELSAKTGIYHLSSRGRSSWHRFAQAIVDTMRLPQPPDVLPITTADYPTPAKRPSFGVLDATKMERNFGIKLPYWEDALRECQS
jgi:dTDP-4-dehydrorhamnose reductase